MRLAIKCPTGIWLSGVCAFCFLGNECGSAFAGEPTNAKESAQQQHQASAVTPEMLARENLRKSAMSPEQLAWEKTLESNLGDYYLPLYYKDKDAGLETAWDYVADDPSLPRVLMIGDSISRGYTLAARHQLKGKFNVHRAPANCGSTVTGLKQLGVWLGDGKWDVIIWNFGIHDRNTVAEAYRHNLETILKRLRKTEAKIIWVRTTPAPPGKNSEGYTDAQCEQLNRIADEVMKAGNVPEVDLYSLLKPRIAELQLPNNVHFRETGYQVMGEKVASAVQEIVLPPRDSQIKK